MNTESKPTALLYWSLEVDCPKCEQLTDLVNQDCDNDYQISNKIFTNRWDLLNNYEVTCEHCGHKFEIERVEY